MADSNSKPTLDEALRLEALEAQKITDTEEDEAFNRLVRMACATMEAPIGTISFVDSERQWFKARQGLDISETSRDLAFCAHAIEGDEVMVVEDATRDPRFADNPLVTCENGIRFYAGAPLRNRQGSTWAHCASSITFPAGWARARPVF
jgi:GAF domain-containing protein